MQSAAADQYHRARVFRELHERSTAFVIPNPWDAGSAKLLAGLGFPALATTSAGLAFSLGRPDGDNRVSRTEALANAADIVAATPLPVTADLESGYGPSPEDVAETIRLAARAGLVGGSIEDATGDPQAPVLDQAAAADRVRAAVEAARSLDFPFTVTARAENFLYGRPDLKDTVARLQAYQEAGADVLYAPGLPDADAVRTVCAELDRPVNVLAAAGGLSLSVAQLAELGVRRISLGSALVRAALGGLLVAAEEMRTTGTFGFAARALPYARANEIFTKLSDIHRPPKEETS
ncbi:isocitrate lyase/phosphoenolpyruvate mutase family protein [Kitasatospora aureofaciens]|uniref:isocitrate lyase/PEP mutase family protein n=1 Tax=Kitasatospora aureofaciens TaxID=1894 RepID=UPI00068CBD75|nr:isocitrate lyase/phosphoenolpyruvate mutase family protein [Kitasatospora aureofaciens]HJD81974.1 isocitrate lyase/phosphoenolpyruvate mutase family protein [Kitasatospora aureofaciens]